MASDQPDFKILRFKSPAVVDRKWLEWFREEFSRRLFKVDMAPKPGSLLQFDGTIRALPDFSIYTGACSPVRSDHSDKLVDSDDFVLTIVQAGDVTGFVNGSEVAMTPGLAMGGRQDIASSLDIHSDAKMLSLRLRRKLIEPLVKDFSAATISAIPADSQELQLLLRYLQMLDSLDTIATPEAQRLVTAHVHELVALALGATKDARALADGSGARAARLAAIKADILDNLARSDLSASNVAARHGVTRRYLDMLFEAAGETFSEYVVGQRLARAHRMLSDPRFAHRSINAIAFDVGFGDLSYFNRTFRRRYGATPSDVREAVPRG